MFAELTGFTSMMGLFGGNELKVAERLLKHSTSRVAEALVPEVDGGCDSNMSLRRRCI